MKKIFLVLALVLANNIMFSQKINGAWETKVKNNKGIIIKTIITFVDGFYVITNFTETNGEFINTSGGSWIVQNNQLKSLIEFDYVHPKNVGTTYSMKITINENILKLNDIEYTRIDNGTPGKLNGAWLMSGRKRNGEIQSRDTSRPRKTMKILSGSRFQWIAYNTETKQFMGTGGGTYSTVNGKYTENIEFFSKDKTRVGMSLVFNYELVDGNWHHSGKSSKGAPIYEIWSIRK
ncbi:MAG: membrane or secreted protein [Flavobacteriaceae bacterium]|nr:membrane or secreted protein [Flavobacteriaceae bacterium]